MTRYFMVLGLVLLLAGCGESKRTKMNQLEQGMSKMQVRQLLGEPYKTEVANGQELWFIETGNIALARMGTPNGTELDETKYLVPIAFENGEVIGWGQSFWPQTQESKYDIKIRER